MDLEPKEAVDSPGRRCEACGVRLTSAEEQAVLESGGPALCTVHAAELAPLAADDDERDL